MSSVTPVVSGAALLAGVAFDYSEQFGDEFDMSLVPKLFVVCPSSTW